MLFRTEFLLGSDLSELKEIPAQIPIFKYKYEILLLKSSFFAHILVKRGGEGCSMKHSVPKWDTAEIGKFIMHTSLL